MVYRPAQVYNGSGWDDIGDKRIGASAGDIPQASVANLTSDLASKLATTVTTKGDLISRSTSAPVRLPVGANGAVLTADSSTTTGLRWSAGSKILQIVRATDSTNRSTTSSSYVDASISVTISPQKSDSAIILLYTVCVNNSGGSASSYCKLQITDNSNNAISGAEDISFGVSTSARNQNGLSLFGYATPATTSSVTYKVRFLNDSGGNTVTLQNSLITGQLYAIEVSA